MLTYLRRTITKRKIQVVLGVLWLLDGLLQLQPQMFTSHFANDVITPAADGQPLFISGPIHFAIHIFLLQPALFNTFIILIQLGIGVLILRKQTIRYGLLASIFWGLFVWYIGEGLGGLATAQTSLLMGAPGAALLYAIISLSVWPKEATSDKESDHPAYWLMIVWGVIWLGGAALQLTMGQNNAVDLSTMVASMGDGGTPGWLAQLDFSVGRFITDSSTWILPAFIGLQALIGFLIFCSRRLRALGIVLGILLSLLFWAVGQSFGDYYTGLATDPSTAPLIILLAIAILGTPPTTGLRIFSPET